MRPLVLLAGLTILSHGMAARLVAQQLTPPAGTVRGAPVDAAHAGPECTYAECGLRVEPSFRGPRLVRGAEGAPVTSLGTIRRAELVQLFARDDSARAYAVRYVRAERVNRLLTYGGAILTAVGVAQSHPANALSATGLVLLGTSIPFQSTSERSLSRAVWWYNRSLAPSPGSQR